MEVTPKDNVNELSVDEIRHITDELRKQATLALPQKNYSVMTRDNIFALIPPDEKEAECLAQSCAVDIGRAIGAEYVTQGSIGKFGDEYSLSIELYETMGAKLLGSIVMESADIKGLLLAIRNDAPGLFGKMYQDSQNYQDLQNVQTVQVPDTLIKDTIPLIPEIQPTSHLPLATSQKSNISKYIAVSLDVLGAVALGFGAYQHFQKEKLYKEYKDMPDGQFTQREYDNAYNKANDAKNLRDIGFIAGGVLVGGSVVVWVWF